jgi:hypothetical protein
MVNISSLEKRKPRATINKIDKISTGLPKIEDDFEKYALEKIYKPGNTTTIIGMYKPIAPDN